MRTGFQFPWNYKTTPYSRKSTEIQWHLVERDFFNGLPDEKRDFVSLAVSRAIEKKDYIFQEGKAGGSAFYLED
jgi:hypothetical protein